MRWIRATRTDGKGEVWVNMAAVFTITREKGEGEGQPYTHLWSADGVYENVIETPEHLVASYR